MLIAVSEASVVRDKTKRVLNMRVSIINAADPDLLTADAPYFMYIYIYVCMYVCTRACTRNFQTTTRKRYDLLSATSPSEIISKRECVELEFFEG